jgi:outer membrane protein TolC
MSSTFWGLRAAVFAGAALLTACQTLSPDGGMETVAVIAGGELNKNVVKIRSAEEASLAHDAVTRLLRQPVNADAAVQIALLNNLDLQAAYNRLGIAEAVAVQESRPPVPSFSFSRVSTSLELDIERQILASILSLATLPARTKIAEAQVAQAQLRAAEETLRVAAQTRRAYYRAVAARQVVAALAGVKDAAAKAAELAGHLTATGAVNKLDQARRQAFATEVEAELMSARQQAVTAREEMIRFMGLWNSDIAARLPSRLPPLPGGLRSIGAVEQAAMDRRIDLQIARAEVEALARSYGLNRKTHFINVLEAGAVSKTQKDRGEPSADGGGFVISFEVPIYDFGKARVREAEQRYLEAVNSLGAMAVTARSMAREAYANYKATYAIAAQYEREVLPLRQTISDETLLQYNAMQVDAFALLEAARAKATAKVASIEAKRNFWLASTDLSVAMLGGGRIEGNTALAVKNSGSAND